MIKILLITGMVISIGLNTYCQVAVTPSQGNGSAESPYQIASLENLYWIAAQSNRWGYHYIQTADINASATITWFSGFGWSPVGYASARFTGYYDGQGFSIDSLYINSTYEYAGLFGYTEGAEIMNMKITDAEITGTEYAGVLAGKISTSEILNCSSTGKITGTNFTGGLIGYADNAEINNCSFNGEVNGAFNTGGLAGQIYYTSIETCGSDGTVNGGWDTGGLIGKSEGYNTSQDIINYINNSNSNALVSGTDDHTGGLIGYINYCTSVTNCNSTGNVSGTAYVGGLIGYNNYRTVINDCYSTGNVTGTTVHIGGFSGYNYYSKVNRCFSNSIVNGEDNTGGFTGTNGSSQVTECFSIGEVTGTRTATGGFVGNNTRSGISDSYSNVTVAGVSYVGGLVGYNYESVSMENCFNFGNVTGSEDKVGGLIGWNEKSTVNNCYNKGNVEGGSYVGGLIGDNAPQSIVNNSYSTGVVNGTGDNTGGLAGWNFQSEINNSFWNTETSGQTISAGGEGKTTTEMKTKSTYTNVGWDFINIWTLFAAINDGYPSFIHQTSVFDLKATPGNGIVELTWNAPTFSEISAFDGYNLYRNGGKLNTAVLEDTFYIDNDVINGTSYGYYVTIIYTEGESTTSDTVYAVPAFESIIPAGNGSAENPYQISSLENLQWLSANQDEWDKHYIQTADINASVTIHWNKGFSPIGKYGNDMNIIPFSGEYNGQGYVIDSLFMDRDEGSWEVTESFGIGLFGCSDGAVIKNVRLTNIDLRGRIYVGGLTGECHGTVITNCHTSGTVSCLELNTGGLAGWQSGNSVIENCSSTCTVSGSTLVGGLIGSSDESIIMNSFHSAGSVTGLEELAGGLIGSLQSSEMTNCYSSGVVNGNLNVGGLVGDVYNSQINNCYSASVVNGLPGADTGGLVGSLYNETKDILNSFWDMEISGQTESEGGEGKSTDEMKTITTYTSAGWDFVDTWHIDSRYNNGYPFLLWQVFPVICPEDLSFCINDPPLTLTEIMPEGIQFSGTGVEDGIFYPAKSGAGNHTIQVNFIEHEEESDCEFTISVSDLPDVSFTGLDGFYCLSSSSVLLTGNPSGGIFTGNGISGDIFTPLSAGAGIWDIIYTFTDINGCANADTFSVEVGECVGISKTNVLNAVLYPNPTSGNFIIELEKPLRNISVEITGITGIIVSQTEYHETKYIEGNLIDLPAGIYFIRISSFNGSGTYKLVKTCKN